MIQILPLVYLERDIKWELRIEFIPHLDYLIKVNIIIVVLNNRNIINIS